MKYDSDFNLSSLFTEKKYRARLILGIYLVFFIVLIAISKSSSSFNNGSSEIKEKEQNESDVTDKENKENKEDVEKDENTKNVLPGFSFLSMNNYEFEYILNINDYEYITTGKRFNDKLLFTVSNKDEKKEYFVSGNTVKVMEDEMYVNSVLPFYYINYFDNDVIQNIIRDSIKVNDAKYEITNLKLSKYIDNSFKYNNKEKDLNNTIELVFKNGNVVAVNFDLVNLFSDVEELKTLKISLNYKNFGLIDDFVINF